MLRLDNDAATDRYFVASSSPPFLAWKEANATSLAAIKPGNFVRYRNLTGASRSVTLQSVDNDAVGIHGIQIINSGTDFDGDGMSDALEIENRFNPAVSDATADADSDGMNNAAEIAAGTDPRHRDTDRDGIADGAEAAQGTSPLNPDSDGDTLTDGEELNPAYFTSFPADADSDDDGFSDSAERTYGIRSQVRREHAASGAGLERGDADVALAHRQRPRAMEPRAVDVRRDRGR